MPPFVDLYDETATWEATQSLPLFQLLHLRRFLLVQMRFFFKQSFFGAGMGRSQMQDY